VIRPSTGAGYRTVTCPLLQASTMFFKALVVHENAAHLRELRISRRLTTSASSVDYLMKCWALNEGPRTNVAAWALPALTLRASFPYGSSGTNHAQGFTNRSVLHTMYANSVKRGQCWKTLQFVFPGSRSGFSMLLAIPGRVIAGAGFPLGSLFAFAHSATLRGG